MVGYRCPSCLYAALLADSFAQHVHYLPCRGLGRL